MLKVCHVGKHMYGGGAELFLSALSKKFKKVRIAQSFILGDEFYVESFANSMGFPVSLISEKEIIKKLVQYDLILHWGPIDWRKILENNKEIITIFVAHSELSGYSYSLAESTSSHIIAVSNKIKDYICYNKLLPTTVLYPGVEPKRVQTSLTQPEARKKLNLNTSKKLVGFLGSLFKEKRLDRLIGIAEQLPEDMEIVIGGEGPLEHELKKTSNEKVHFLGKVNDVDQFYKAIDFFCLPSEKEGCPQVMFESMCAKIPFISTPVGAVSEIVKDKMNGVLFDGSQESLLKSLSFANENVETLTKNGYNTFIEMGDINKTAKHFENVLIEVYIKNKKINKMI